MTSELINLKKELLETYLTEEGFAKDDKKNQVLHWDPNILDSATDTANMC